MSVAQRRDPSRLLPRAQCGEAMKPEVRRVFDANFKVHGARKVWRQMQREGFDIPHCRVERLMRDLALQEVICGRRQRCSNRRTAQWGCSLR